MVRRPASHWGGITSALPCATESGGPAKEQQLGPCPARPNPVAAAVCQHAWQAKHPAAVQLLTRMVSTSAAEMRRARAVLFMFTENATAGGGGEHRQLGCMVWSVLPCWLARDTSPTPGRQANRLRSQHGLRVHCAHAYKHACPQLTGCCHERRDARCLHQPLPRAQLGAAWAG